MNALLAVFADLWELIKATRRIYLSLLVVFLLLMGAIIVLTERSVTMPFIYAFF
ncbi:MAG: DUF5989 family protein [Desulfobulbaceae bacterium]|nr:DUF5989 family protein [Desulfobulbaceae bacterium]